MRFLIKPLLFLLAHYSFAQNPIPVGNQSTPIALVGGTIHIGDGNVIEKGSIAFKDGIITEIVSGDLNINGYNVIDIAGKHVYPGFILPVTQLGLLEIDAVRATLDYRERGELNPSVRSIIAYNTDSEVIPTFRYNGILMAQITPWGGVIAGTSSIVELEGWNWEDALYKEDDAIHLNWPIHSLQPRWWLGETKLRDNKDYDRIVASLEDIFRQSSSTSTATANLKLEAMKGIFEGTKQLFIYADKPDAIIESISFAKRHKVKKIVLVGGKQADKVVYFLKKNNIPVLISNVHRLPSSDRQDIYHPYKLPSILMKEGLLVGLTYDDANMQSSRNLPFLAGTSVAFGLTKEQALSTISLNTAKILGIDSKVGSLIKGKQATLFVSEGDALDMRTNDVYKAFIKGKDISLDGRQQFLYEKYKEKYQHN